MCYSERFLTIHWSLRYRKAKNINMLVTSTNVPETFTMNLKNDEGCWKTYIQYQTNIPKCIFNV